MRTVVRAALGECVMLNKLLWFGQ